MHTWESSCIPRSRQANLPFGKLLYERNISFQEVDVGQFRLFGPSNLSKNAVLKFAGELPHKKEVQLKGGAARVGVPDDRNSGTDICQNTELFFQFAIQSRTKVLAGLDFAPGKFPFERHGLVASPLTHEDSLVTNYQSSNNLLHWFLSLRSTPLD